MTCQVATRLLEIIIPTTGSSINGSRLQGAHEAMLEDCWHNCVRFIRDMLAFDDGETRPFLHGFQNLAFEALQL